MTVRPNSLSATTPSRTLMPVCMQPRSNHPFTEYTWPPGSVPRTSAFGTPGVSSSEPQSSLHSFSSSIFRTTPAILPRPSNTSAFPREHRARKKFPRAVRCSSRVYRSRTCCLRIAIGHVAGVLSVCDGIQGDDECLVG